MSEDGYLFKITIVGEPDISYDLVASFCDGKFDNKEQSYVLGVDISTKKIQIGKASIKLILITLLHEGFIKQGSYFQGAMAGIFVFNKGNFDSFQKATAHYLEFRRHIPDLLIPTALIGFIGEPQEKITTESPFLRLAVSEEVSTEVGQSFAESKDIDYFEMRKMDTETFEEIIYHLTKKALASKKESDQ